MNLQEVQQKYSPLLRPLSKGYALALRLRAQAYKKELKKSRQPKAPCISVGNIAWGGSGKTPLVSWLLDWAAAKGLRPAVLTRGYGGKSAKRPLPVTPASRLEECGDEPLMLALQHPAAQILADPRRGRALAWSEARSPGDLYILDDGMQHLALRRDLNLVILRAVDLTEQWDRVIPAGSWREGKEALGRADAFLLRAPAARVAGLEGQAGDKLSGFNAPLFSFDLKPCGLCPLEGWPPGGSAGNFEAASLQRPYVLCTAVGSPDAVRESACALSGLAAVREFIFPDHYRYRLEDLLYMAETGLPVLTTAKDAVKLRVLQKAVPRLEVLVLQSRIEFGPALFTDLSFADWLDNAAAGWLINRKSK